MVAAAAFVHSDLTDKHLNEALFLVWFCWLVVLAHSLHGLELEIRLTNLVYTDRCAYYTNIALL